MENMPRALAQYEDGPYRNASQDVEWIHPAGDADMWGAPLVNAIMKQLFTEKAFFSSSGT
jgi:hypothetical protein